MDTKSKKYKYSYGMKVAAFMLALVLGFSSAFFAALATDNLYNYGSAVLTKPTERLDVAETSAFTAQLTNDLQSIYTAGGIRTWAQYKEEKFSSYEEELQLAQYEFKAFKEDSMSSAVARYYAGKGESNAEASPEDYETTTLYQGSSSDTVIPNYDKTYYNNCSRLYFLEADSSKDYGIPFRTQMTEKELAEAVSIAYNQRMNAAKRRFESTINLEGQAVQSLRNLKYYIANAKTGAVLTNLAEPPADAAAAQEMLEKSAWHMMYTAEHGLGLHSAQITDSTFETTLREVLDDCFAENDFDVYLFLEKPLVEGDAYYTMQQMLESNAPRTYNYIMLSIMFLLLTGILSVYLILVSGHVGDTAGIKLGMLDRMPTDFHLFISFGLAFCGMCGVVSTMKSLYYDYAVYRSLERFLFFAVAALLAAAVWAVLQEWICSTAKVYKAKVNWLQKTLIYRFVVWIIKIAKRLVRPVKNVFCSLKTKTTTVHKKVFLFVGIYVFLNVIITALGVGLMGGWSFFWLLAVGAYNLIVLALIWKYIVTLDKIIVASEQTKEGKAPGNIAVEEMPEPLKTLAGNLSITQEELQRAVGEAIKGERMKTELITNVSHDLKTPLTSIISYVNLLKKCDIDDISAQKYITVLDEKSIRLKRLIEDLVEASKASSGTIVFHKMHVNFYELAVQAIGEMSDVFEERRLEIILNEPADPPVIFADSQKTWRIIDNLLSNVKKYALEGTRVYLEVEKKDGFGVFTVKNTSRDALNIDPEELTNRFVRGDESRTLEGSGLGLSIAKDLCTLQGGVLQLSIDGDLFKAVVKMPLAPEPAPEKPDEQTEPPEVKA